jgi:hypothetical protein
MRRGIRETSPKRETGSEGRQSEIERPSLQDRRRTGVMGMPLLDSSSSRSESSESKEKEAQWSEKFQNIIKERLERNDMQSAKDKLTEALKNETFKNNIQKLSEEPNFESIISNIHKFRQIGNVKGCLKDGLLLDDTIKLLKSGPGVTFGKMETLTQLTASGIIGYYKALEPVSSSAGPSEPSGPQEIQDTRDL